MNNMPLQGHSSICEHEQPIIVSKDVGKCRHIAKNLNLNYVTHYKIDGVVITKVSRCDFIVINEDAGIAYLIELKGSDLVKAARQLEDTEKVLEADLRNYSIRYRIVLRKVKTQAIESVTFKKFKKRKGKALAYGTDVIEENI